MFAISPEESKEHELMRKNESLGEAFVFLSDIDGELAAKYAGMNEGVNIPATYVIDKDGKIVFRFVEEDFTLRPVAADVLQAVKDLID